MNVRPLDFTDSQRKHYQSAILNRCVPEPNSGCWLWEGSMMNTGYGILRTKQPRAQHLAHRVSYAAFVKNIRHDEFILHHCDNPLCVNPDHLFAGTHDDNMRDMVAKGRSCLGERNAQRRLTESEIVAIREKGGLATGVMDQWGISRQQACDIQTGVAWPHVAGTRRGSRKRGSSHYLAKLTESEVRAVFLDSRSHQSIADEYGVSRETVTRIKNFKVWTHVTRGLSAKGLA